MADGSTVTRVDVAVIGAGIAGLMVAAEFARERSVLLLEADDGPAQQTTGRSASLYFPHYGGPHVMPFTAASRAWLESGGGADGDRSLLSPRGLLAVAAPEDEPDFDEYLDPTCTRLTAREAVELFPALRPERCAVAVFDPGIQDIDAAGSVAAARRALRARGGELRTSARVEGIERATGAWRLRTPAGTVEAEVIVDAAGAWADEVATMAGLPPIGLRPLRRTVCTFLALPGLGQERWPMLHGTDERFYVKPEAGGFLASPADETPSTPCDPRPEMLDVATAIDHVQTATTLTVTSVHATWAGLRTFAPDRVMVIGPDPLDEGFVWFAGLGGSGMMSSSGAARAVVSLTRDGVLPPDVIAAGGDRASVVPDRFRGLDPSETRDASIR